jgi:ATP-dependent DNA helicase RecQ
MLNDLSASLHSHFGFDSFRPGQREAIESLLAGRHTLVVMPTGSGKSLIYQLAALGLPGLTLVISPLIALMKDQVDGLVRRGIPAAYINSTLSPGEQERRLKTLAEGGYRLVYIAPERLRSAQFRQAIQAKRISLMAVDEAHCISEWGHDFRPDYLHIVTARAALGNPLTAALTATATPRVQDDIARLLGLVQPHRIVTGFNRPNLYFEVRSVRDPVAKLGALRQLLLGAQDGATIVYTGTRRDAEEVADFARLVIGRQAEHYHAGLDAEERARVQDAFLSGKLSLVIATNAFGMGIDRADVRRVIHYSMPGTLEAYYQEAGRAGRDGKPANAVLLYAPDDRALQEWFIANSATTLVELRSLHEILRSFGKEKLWISTEDLSVRTGLPDVKVRLCLAELERAGALERLGDAGLHMLVRLGEWNRTRVEQAEVKSREHQRHRQAQLVEMIAYAETNECRRRILLKHFGDTGLAEADSCCDNCLSRATARLEVSTGASPGQADRTALIVLDTARRLKNNVGCTKLAQILKGSSAADMKKFGYDNSPYYGRLAVFKQYEIEWMIDQLAQMDYFKIVGGRYPVLALTPKGVEAVKGKIGIPLKLPRKVTPEQVEKRKAEKQAGGTVAYSGTLHREGYSPEQIAKLRGLSLITIYSHLARLIAAGEISVDTVVPGDIRLQIEAATERVGSVQFLAPLKEILPEEISFGEIRCVIESWKRSHIIISTVDSVRLFLSQPHHRKLQGSWDAGWALDFHSRFSGGDWQRSGCGELAYRLKYQGDLTALPGLVDEALNLIGSYPLLKEVDLVTIVPPSMERPVNPVEAFAEALARRLGLSVSHSLKKTRPTAQQKEMHTLAQKRANVAGAFAVQTPVEARRILVIDDLFDSGATLEEVTRVLRQSGAARVNVLTLTRTIHSEG